MQLIGSRIRLFTQIGLATAIMIGLVAMSGSSSSSEPSRRVRLHPKVTAGAAQRIEALYAGVPQHGAVLGDPNAPVTLQFFGDLECREAREFVIGALPFLIRSWVGRGELRIVYRPNPEETIWPGIYERQEVAALAAGRQGRLWQYIDFFYHEQGLEFTRYAIDHFLRAIAGEVNGLDLARWTSDRHLPSLVERVWLDLQLANSRHIRYTPAFLVGPTGGPPRRLLHFSLTETLEFDRAIERALRVT